MNRQHSINNEMNATSTTPTVAADTRHAKRARGRPKKKPNMFKPMRLQLIVDQSPLCF